MTTITRSSAPSFDVRTVRPGGYAVGTASAIGGAVAMTLGTLVFTAARSLVSRVAPVSDGGQPGRRGPRD